MALQSTNATSYLFNPSSLLSLYELDSRYVSVNGARYFFHAGVNGLYQHLIWNSVTYNAFPIEMDDFATDGKGGAVRPKLRMSNVRGFTSALLLTMGDLIGAKLTRTRVFSRFLPGENFANGVNPFGAPDPTAAYEPEVFFVNRKVTENPDMVEFELTSPYEIDNVQLPRRPMLATVCTAVYRDPETCGYSGAPVTDRFGKSFTAALPAGYGYTLSDKGIWSALVTYAVGDWVTIISQGDFTFGDRQVYVCGTAGTIGDANNPQFNSTNWVADACSHNLAGCLQHFPTGPLPGGFFPGTSRSSYSA